MRVRAAGAVVIAAIGRAPGGAVAFGGPAAGVAYAFNRWTGKNELGSLGFFSIAKMNAAFG